MHFRNKRRFIKYILDINFQNHLLQNVYNIIPLLQENIILTRATVIFQDGIIQIRMIVKLMRGSKGSRPQPV